MDKNMPDISFERSMNHNYMILSRCDFFGTASKNTGGFKIKMLLENKINGLLPISYRIVNGDGKYYYEINSLQSLERLYDKNEIKYDELRKIFEGCINLFAVLEEYLLDGSQIIMRPEFIYMNVERMEPYFVCYPDYEGDVRREFMEFVDLILTKIDHNDNRAVMLGYQIYRYTRNQNYVISEILNIIQREESKKDAIAVNEKNPCEPVGIINTPKLLLDNYDYKFDEKYDYDNQDKTPKPQAAQKIPPKRKLKLELKKNSENKTNNESKNKGLNDILGIAFCAIITLLAVLLIAGGRFVNNVNLGENGELYLCGAIAMSITAMAVFANCYIKNKRHKTEIESLSTPQNNQPQYEQPQYEQLTPNPPQLSLDGSMFIKDYAPPKKDNMDTVYLDDKVIEDRLLVGRVNGVEMTIPLNRLPVTIGKQSGVSDITVNDNTVSKMHARFEEHDGRVYVCDLNSTNGTVRNGTMLDINSPVILEPGDRLRFGRSCFTYC